MNGSSGTAEPSAVETPTTAAARTGRVSRTGARAIRTPRRGRARSAASASTSRPTSDDEVWRQARLHEAPSSCRLPSPGERGAAVAEHAAQRRAELALGARGRVGDAGHRDRLGEQRGEPGRDHDPRRARRDRHAEDEAEDVHEAVLSAEDHVANERGAAPARRSFGGARGPVRPRRRSRDGDGSGRRPCATSSRERAASRYRPLGPGCRAIRPDGVGYTRPTMTSPVIDDARVRPSRRRLRTFSGIQPSGVAAHRQRPRRDPQLRPAPGRVRGDLLHRRLPRPDEHPRRRPAPRARTREMAASLLALGLDPERCTLFVQSHRPEHTELAWLLATVTPVSWLERTPTYKEKTPDQPDDINHGLLTYPVLQAADIVIYKATPSPSGTDQAAHLELSREIVRAFNNRYGEHLPRAAGRLHRGADRPGTDGARKMSKSLGNTIESSRPRVDPPPGDVDGHRHAADQADRPGPAGGLQRLPAPPLLRRRLPRDLGRRTDRAGPAAST